MSTNETVEAKPHRGKKRKLEKNKSSVIDPSAEKRNPKAFAFQSAVKAQRQNARTQDLRVKKHHIPVIDRTPLEPPPVIVAIVGGSKVGKSTLMRCLIKNYTRQKLSTLDGPVTIIAGKKKRLTFVEVKNDINVMIDIAKVADIVLMLIDVTFGIEMEIFEFLEICRAYGTPRVMGILNHLDLMKDNKALKKKKKDLKHRFQVELYPGAKLFYLSGIIHGEYLKNEVSNLGRFISVMKFRPLHFRMNHPYVLVDRMEDITNVETIRQNSKCDRKVVLYGYIRGIPLREKQAVHIPGCGDFHIKETSILEDPCPLPETLKKRSLNSKERLLYAPMSGVSGVVYDKDAVYIDLGGSHHMRKENRDSDDEEQEDKGILEPLLQLKKTTDEKRAESNFKLFSSSQPIRNVENIDLEKFDIESCGQPKFETIVEEDGRVRRKVIFEEGDVLNNEDDDIESEEEEGWSNDDYDIEEDEEKNNNFCTSRNPKLDARRSLKNGDEMTKSISDVLQIDLPGLDKSQILSASDYVRYYRRVIYSEAVVDSSDSEDENDDDDDDRSMGGLFKKPEADRRKNKEGKFQNTDIFYEVDSSKSQLSQCLRDWNLPHNLDAIKDCFVTGEWSDKEDAGKLLKMDSEDVDIYGDFEDIETGQKYKGKKEENDEVSNKDDFKKLDEAKSAQEKRLDKKKRLKEYFDSEYDDKGEGEHFESLKTELSHQAELNRTQFESMDDETRIQYEGYRAGLYVRMEFENMYCEFVTNFDSSYPIIVGGLLDNEQSMGYLKVRMKVHRWYPRILKNRDPLNLSLGWRRFQSIMYYAKREDNFRYRSLKYARKFLHVEALLWGPITEPSSGFIALQNINDRTNNFRIAANGVVLENDQSTKLVKKMKLLGYPEKVHKNTAFIKDMFHSDTEAVKFIGAKIQTQSSIRGIIKKSIGLEGSFRATFEDQIKMSDTVILKTWAIIEVNKFCSIVKNLLLPEKSSWKGLKTNAEIKREQNIRNLVNPDTLYTPIEKRCEYTNLPLKIPKALQKALPYKDKPKIKPKIKKHQRVIVVKDPEEVKIEDFMKKLKVMMFDKKVRDKTEKKLKQKLYKKEIREKEAFKKIREKKNKAFACKFKTSRKGRNEI